MKETKRVHLPVYDSNIANIGPEKFRSFVFISFLGRLEPKKFSRDQDIAFEDIEKCRI